MTDIERIRLKINDHLKPEIDKDEGDGETRIFKLTHHHIQDYTVKVNNVEQIENTDYVIDTTNGVITFTTAPADGYSVITQYKYAGFTDTEIQNILDEQGSITNAVIECIKILMFDASRQFDYRIADEEVTPSQIFKNLKEMLELYKSSQTPTIINRINEHYKPTEDLDDDDLTRIDTGLED
ncbi:MAG: hypothetical protein DRP74_07280 [Candidatus Omnitrophota bacterium]|nr:MAG: hypothetical protein DRP74_07280 [Candidatus Omnitrophota bacterium]